MKEQPHQQTTKESHIIRKIRDGTIALQSFCRYIANPRKIAVGRTGPTLPASIASSTTTTQAASAIASSLDRRLPRRRAPAGDQHRPGLGPWAPPTSASACTWPCTGMATRVDIVANDQGKPSSSPPPARGAFTDSGEGHQPAPCGNVYNAELQLAGHA